MPPWHFPSMVVLHHFDRELEVTFREATKKEPGRSITELERSITSRHYALPGASEADTLGVKLVGTVGHIRPHIGIDSEDRDWTRRTFGVFGEREVMPYAGRRAMTAAIQVIKFVNGDDADTAPGPHVPAGSTVTFTYVVTDTGDVPLANVTLTDSTLGTITTFTGTATATACST
jgi:hypothetical protein